MNDRVLNAAERAACLGVSVRTFQRLNKAGMGPKGCTLSALRAWLKSKEKAAHKEAAEEILEDGQRTGKLR